MEENERQLRGYSILAKGDKPVALNEETFLVPSQSSLKKYQVSHIDGWTCECKDFNYRKKICKHIYSIQYWLKLRNGINSNELMKLENSIENERNCVYCKSSNIVKNGSRNTKSGIKQRFLCRDCKKRFVLEMIKHFKGNSQIITLSMDLYFKGLSLRDIQDTIYQFYGLRVHHETVRRWIFTFTKTMNEYVSKFKPKVSKEIWQLDEQAIKSKGEIRWSWNILDPKTRFLIANQITDDRYIKDARKILAKAKENIKDIPQAIITDGLPAYREAIEKEYNRTQNSKQKKSEHIKLKTIRSEINNNKLERFHSTFRQRDKVMRGFKGREQDFADSFRSYYNFIKKHQGLKGLTPSQKAKIDLQLDRNRWLSLLKKSIENKGVENDNA